MRSHLKSFSPRTVKTLSKAFLTKWALRQSADPTTKFVLLTLAAVADGKGVCRISLNQLAALTGLSRDSVKRALTKLDGHLIERESRRRGNGSTHTSVTKLKVHTAPRARCTQPLGGEVHTAPPIGYVDINSTKKESLDSKDRYYLDNYPNHLDERLVGGDYTCGGLL